MGTNKDHLNLIKTGFGFLLLVLLQTRTEAQICEPSMRSVNFDENNEVGAVITTIPGADNLQIESTDDGPFRIEGTNLVATAVLDYENGKTSFNVRIRCTPPGSGFLPIQVVVIVKNLNDNPPRFEQPLYSKDVDEMTPIDTVVGTFAAQDKDNLELFYTLTSESDAFKLQSRNQPTILVAKLLDYDKVKTVQLTLTVQDSDPVTPSHTDSTTIDITIKDVDNRPPWFQPCEPIEIQGVKICPNQGYTGSINIGEQTTGALPLKPGPILAIDGDAGINEAVTYSIISGNDGLLFAMSPDTGEITMLKETDVTNPIHMTIMASQKKNSYLFATTGLTIQVVIKSLHRPQFEKTQYDVVVEGVGRMAMEAADKDKAVKIIATDQDYAGVGGINPNIVYTIEGSTAFSVIDGFLFMTTEVPGGSYNLQVTAEDSTNFETATAQLAVEVVPEPTTTPPPTTISTAPTSHPTSDPTVVTTAGSTIITTVLTTIPTFPTTVLTTMPSTDPTKNPTPNPNPTGESPITTPDSTIITSEPSVQTSHPTPTTEGTTRITAHTGSVIPPPGGGFSSGEMAAVGATLGCLLFVCVVVIAVLAVQIRKGNADWKKVNEASVFRSSLGPSGQKEGVHFTNEAFQHDDDKKSGPSGGLQNGTVPTGLEKEKPQTRTIPRPPSPIQDDPSEKEVKPILTKEKAREDGYKAVWFKEDIDPNAKEDVVIIPDNRADEEEEDEEDEMKVPKVKFNEADRDSGHGAGEDSEEEKVETSNL